MAQAFATFSLLVVGYALGGLTVSFSLFVGGIVCLLPALYLFSRAFRVLGASKSKKIVNSFYAGQAGKFVLTAILFAIVFQIETLNVPCVFIGFVGVQLVHGMVPLVSAIKRNKVTKQRVLMGL